MIKESLSPDAVLRKALTETPLPLVLTEKDGRVVFANKPACRSLGIRAEGAAWESGAEKRGSTAVEVRLDETATAGQGGWYQLGVSAATPGWGSLAGKLVWAGLANDEQGGSDELPLTPREREILGLIAGGLRTDEIAGELTLSPETVKSHVHNAMTKLRAHTRSQAVAIAITRGQLFAGDQPPSVN